MTTATITPTAIEIPSIAALIERLAELDDGDVRDRKFVAFSTQCPDWAAIDVSPGRIAPFWHVAVVEFGSGSVLFTRRAIDRGAVAQQLIRFSVRAASFREIPGVESATNPFDQPRPVAGSAEDTRFVYFIQAVIGGPIKIGVSDSPRSRLDQIQYMSPVALDVIGVIPGVGQAEETRLHKLFAAHRSHGEWFHPAPELLAYIAEHADQETVRA